MPRLSKQKHLLRANLVKARSSLAQATAVSGIGDQNQLDEAPGAIYQQNDGDLETHFQLEEETMTLSSEESQVRARVYQANISECSWPQYKYSRQYNREFPNNRMEKAKKRNRVAD